MKENSIDVVEIKTHVLEENDIVAARIRKMLKEQNVFFVNLMSSPGAGKTTTLARTIESLKGRYRIGVIEADVDSTVDAETIRETGARVVQVHNGGTCHMDAGMTAQGLEKLGIEELDLIFLENIGNLVCPAEFDVGAVCSLMILSVPEGDDKPLKYPLMFQVSDCLLINKTDTMEIFDFDMNALRERVDRLHPGCPVFPVSSLTGDGYEDWIGWLTAQIEDWRAK